MDPMRTEIDAILCPDPTADTLARLENHHLDAAISQGACCCKSRKTGSNDDYTAHIIPIGKEFGLPGLRPAERLASPFARNFLAYSKTPHTPIISYGVGPIKL